MVRPNIERALVIGGVVVVVVTLWYIFTHVLR